MRRYWYWYNNLKEPKRFLMMCVMCLPFWVGTCIVSFSPMGIIVMLPTFILVMSKVWNANS